MKADKNLGKTLNISYAALFFSFALTLFKLLAGFLGNSTALIANSIRSLSELINELKKLLEVFIASKPEDRSHDYWHGKIATLFTGAGACILLFAGIESIILASQELLTFIQGREIEAPEILALSAAALTLVSREIVPFLSRRPGEQIDGTLLETDPYTKSAQTRSLLLSCFVTLGIGCTFLPGKNWVIADSFIAVLMSLYLLGASGRLLYSIANEFIEDSLDEEDNKKIRKIINRTEGVTGSGELKTRKIGSGIAINACITVSESLNIQEVIEIADWVENRLKIAYGQDMYIHIKAEPDLQRNYLFLEKKGISEKGLKEITV